MIKEIATFVQDLIDAGLPQEVAFTAGDYVTSSICMEEWDSSAWSDGIISILGGFPWVCTPEGGWYWHRYYSLVEAIYEHRCLDDVEYAARNAQWLIDSGMKEKEAFLMTDYMTILALDTNQKFKEVF